MNGWMDERMYEWEGGCMEGRKDGGKDEPMDE
jgi:hypothetical protein